MVESIAYCHKKSVVHRDVKLENFLVDVDSKTSGISIKLIDFGVSKKIAPGSTLTGLAGTILNMAPEILQNRDYNEKVDCWSLGICLVELLTNAAPFDDHDEKIHKQNII